jgi:putative redox protein
MSQEKTITAHITETGESDYAVSIAVSGHEITGDEPIDAGGKDLGPAPYDLLSAALGECTAMTIRWYAIQQKWPLDKVEVTLTFQKINKVGIFKKKITIHGDNLSQEQRQKLIEVAAKCPVQRTLEGKIEIQTIN